MKQCHQCGTMLPDSARYCVHCGAPQFQLVGTGSGNGLDLKATLEPQLQQHFFESLHTRLEEEQPGASPKAYFKRLQEYPFVNTFQLRIRHLAEEIKRSVAVHGEDIFRVQRRMEDTFGELFDFFLIHYCRDINTIALPPTILKYQGSRPEKLDLYQIVLDYLDFGSEDEQVYLLSEFVAMPAELIRNAGKHFLLPEKNERIFFICDQSLLGDCREGFAFTEKALYWKAHLQKPQKVHYAKIKAVEPQKNWITINDHFFNVNPSLNVKVLKLMRKLQGWCSR